MQAQREAPPDMQCKDKFLIQSVVTTDGATQKDITPEMVSSVVFLLWWIVCQYVLLIGICFSYTQFNKDSGNHLEECKLRVVYVSPPQPPSPVAEGSEEGSSPRASVSDIGNGTAFDSVCVWQIVISYIVAYVLILKPQLFDLISHENPFPMSTG